ncbi:hypothetical protein SAMD00019534_061830 [Acytostelium subglobosum LB1]|uniref:hypothetical protein n=1 Tax=Acytostelium subglobosum LB1 TaxID=1410327 RepID=UPI000644A678|nr:hypothetical protein SAMD00019534_061830 [Acytostelium subglobosum LB1]GAM23008.1 hypothetical protein SAMD00019534_061830 [Acytostelium subglobosum LB1]|eukprot:XP_012754235.1 hypothetical protein SAMD00019534_061830 [Acytostelium subglobosum LB1]
MTTINSNKLLQQGISKDGKTVRIENTKIKQVNCPAFLRAIQPLSFVSAVIVKNCRLKTLPPDIGELVQLRRLVLEDNKLTETPSFERLESLEELVLAGNDINVFHPSIAKLSQLRMLDFSSNSLSSIPVRMTAMERLREIYLDHNQFSNFPSHMCDLDALTSLSFADNQIRSMSDAIGRLRSLTKLVMAGNLLEVLPAEISNLVNLTYLDVSSNFLSALPDTIGALTRLQYLYLQHNKLAALPDQLAGCTALLVLRINDNALSYIPATIGQLTQLTEIHAHENKLMTLPQEIEGCLALKKLTLEYNRLAMLPQRLDQLNSLNFITLHDNSLTELPSFLHVDFLQHVVRLTLHNNISFDQLVAEMQGSNPLPPTHNAIHVLQQHYNNSVLAESSSSIFTVKEKSQSNSNGNGNSTGLSHSGSFTFSSSPLKGFFSSPTKRRDSIHQRPKGLGTSTNISILEEEGDTEGSDTNSNHSGSGFLKRNSISPRNSIDLGVVSSPDVLSASTLLPPSPSQLSTSPSLSSSSSSTFSQQLYKPRDSISSMASLSLHNPAPSSSSTGGSGTPPLPTMSITRSPSTLLNILSNRRRSISNNAPTSPPPSPQYRHYQSLFESLIDDLDYSRKRKEDMLNIPNDDKWSFLQKLKPDCTSCLISNGVYVNSQIASSTSDLKSLLSSPPKVNQSATGSFLGSPRSFSSNFVKLPKSPRGYAKVMSTHQLNTLEDIKRIGQSLSEKSVTWVVNFAESGGIVAILTFISAIMSKDSRTEDDYAALTECLYCLKVLVELEMQSILLTDATDTIFPLVLMPNLPVKRNAFEVLDLLCKTFYIGSSITLESIKNFAKRKNLSMQQAYDYIVSPLSGEYTADLKVNCMSLVNHFIKNCRKVQERVEMRNLFVACDILKIIKEVRIDGEGIATSSWKALETEMALFESSMVDDENSLSMLTPRLSGIELSDSGGEENVIATGVGNSDARLTVLIACTSEEGSITGPVREVLVPISKKTQVSDVIRTITSSNSNLKDFGEWGLFMRDIDKATQEGRFLKDEEYLADHQALNDGANQFREYSLKMVPWRVRVCLDRIKEMGLVCPQTSSANKGMIIVEEPMDPTMTCAVLVGRLIRKYLPKANEQYSLESDDFGLYLDSFGFGTGGQAGYWLEPLEKLHVNKEIFKDPKCSVTLRLRLKLVKLKFADDTFEQVRLDLTAPTQDVFKEIAQKIVDPVNGINLSHYGIFVDRLGEVVTHSDKQRKTEWIEPGRPLYHYKISDRVCLRFAVRPTPITLMMDSSLLSPATEKQQQQPPEIEPLTISSSAATPHNMDAVASLMMPTAKPIELKSITVQIPLHLPLHASLDTDENWLQSKVEQAKCLFHIDSFDGPVINQYQPLNSQYFTTANKIYVELAEESDQSVPDYMHHNATNIWEEVNDRTTIFFDVNPVTTKLTNIIRGATLNKLVEISTNNIDVDRDTMNVLLLTYMSFTTSDTLLEKLIERYNVPDHIEKKNKNVIQLHVIVFIKNWLEQQSPQAASGGGLEERFLERINQFIDRLSGDGYANMVPPLRKLVESGIKKKRAYAMPEVSRSLNNSSKLPSLQLSFLEDELFVAQQLTLREFDIFKRIQPVEFLNQAWNKAKLQYKAANLLKMIDHFNKTSVAISTSILSQPKIKARVKLICHYINIALHLRKLNNFHLLTAFLAGIHNSSVLRLRLSWSKVPKKLRQQLEELEEVMSMEASFKTYRTLIKELIPPCIPYLGVYLKDLTFIEDGNSDSVDGLINWAKKKLIYTIISIIQGCQDINYDFGPSSPSTAQRAELVLASFDSLPMANDEVLYQMSQQLEPKQNGVQ